MCRVYRGQTICRPGGGVSPPKLIQPKPQPVLEGKSRADCPCRVLMWAIVDKNGRVSDSTIRRSVDPDFDRRALEEVKKWVFQPAHLLRDRVAVEIDLEVDFQ